jgi:hypothetical protein
VAHTIKVKASAAPTRAEHRVDDMRALAGWLAAHLPAAH